MECQECPWGRNSRPRLLRQERAETVPVSGRHRGACSSPVLGPAAPAGEAPVRVPAGTVPLWNQREGDQQACHRSARLVETHRLQHHRIKPDD